MGADTKIEWAHHTYNPWIGCERLSPACDHCYAADWAGRYGQAQLWQGERRQTSAATRHKPIKWDREAQAAGERHRVFCGSLMDFADNQVPSRWRDDAWHIIDQCGNLDWMVLSKRPQNYRKMLPTPAIGAPEWGDGWPHVWLGTTIEDRRRLVNLEHLRQVPAAVRFLSIEPLLEDLGELDLSGIHLVIVGGESGPQARPMHPAWVRSILRQCLAQGVAFFFKQWGEHRPLTDAERKQACGAIRIGNDPYDRDAYVLRVGKKAAGRLLDGREHNDMPRAA